MPPKKQQTIGFSIKQFNMNMVGDNKKLVFIGKTGSGKSYLILDYLYHNQDVPIVNVISPTEELNGTYTPHVPAMLIHDEFNDEVITNIMDRQKNLVQEFNEGCDIDPRTICIMDDCLADSEDWVNDRNIKWVFDNGRHAQMTFIIALQYPVGIPPKLRSNIQYAFLSRENSVDLQKKYYNLYAGCFPNFNMFQDCFLKCTENRGCLVIKNESLSSKLEDIVFHYRVDTTNKPDWDTFKLCYRELWAHNDEIIALKRRKKSEAEISNNKYKKNAIVFKINKKK
jgi:hypothetical protein